MTANVRYLGISYITYYIVYMLYQHNITTYVLNSDSNKCHAI